MTRAGDVGGCGGITRAWEAGGSRGLPLHLHPLPPSMMEYILMPRHVGTSFYLLRASRDRGSRHCTGDSDQDHPQGNEMQKGKLVLSGGLTNSYEERLKAKEKRKDIPL